jgi:hypothetical protein
MGSVRVLLVASAALAVACARHPGEETRGSPAAPPAAPRAAVRAQPCTADDPVAVCRPACDAGDAQSCAFLGIALLQAGDRQAAEQPLTRACRARIALGCGGLGSLHVLRKEWRPARTFLQDGCSMGDGLSCESLGGLVQGADGAPAAADVAQRARDAIPFYRKACALGATRGCGWVAAAIDDGLVSGTLEEALTLYVKACGGGDPMPIACRQAVGLLRRGTPEARRLAAGYDVKRLTADLLARGCKLGDQPSCALLSGQ